ncbi:MAG: FtsX-like permease family protein [Polyangiaceae bacterium]
MNDPKRSADIGQVIDRGFDDSDTQTLSQDERSFNASFLASISAVLKAIDIVSLVILSIMMLVLGNTIAMGVRERTNEYGVLRALGFSRYQLAGLVVGESVAAGLVGGLAGVLLAYPLVERGMGRWLEENMGAFFPFFRIDPMTSVAAVLIALVLSMLAALLPAWQVTKLDVIEALRRVE